LPSEENDYVWSFAVHAEAEAPLYEDPLVEMVRVFLEDFLNMGFFTCDGKKVRIDGFAFANNPQKLYAVFRDSLSTDVDNDD
jgi:hypothetical protein